MTRYEIMGCPVDSDDIAQTILKIERHIAERTLCQHVVVNVSKFVEMQKNQGFKAIINRCDIINADGMPIVWAARLLGTPLSSRVAGVDLFQALIRVCDQKKYKPFFFGAEQWVVEHMVSAFQKQYPTLQVAGFRNGYYSEHEESDIAKEIKNSGADMLFVGFSSPKKEQFLNRWIPEMGVPFCMGVGGSFDVIAGKTKRAPGWMQHSGLEWLYRIYQEPRRMWKRYAKTNPAFIWMLMKALARKKKTSAAS
ncbi:MAG: WecB/TagA/CpsF family glycosyltransferase [Desulfobacterales bacterium]|jgi:N-acetylglucosaminyldiphosphoundecaprenol N-acetyl-beta-D-mannosaminyltransferase|nr:WecB/TagA/CpsF family glycosyltransferase [Desulfobacterales bacterium]